MGKNIIVNHVMSADIHSHIFDAILGYFLHYAGPRFSYAVSIKPMDDADVYHYHRPQLEHRGLRKESVVTVHSDLNSYDAATEYAIFANAYANAAKIVCLNSSQQDFLIQRGFTNTTIIPHGYNESVFTPKACLKKSDGKLRLGVFSRRYANNCKGDDCIAELWRRLPPEKFTFLFVGEDRYLSQMQAEFYGFAATSFEHLPYHLYNQLYHSIDALLVPSHNEGGPANLPEAAATLTPILSRRIGMAPDGIKEGVNGYFIGDDVEADCELLLQLADNVDGAWNELADRITRHECYFPTWQGVVKRYEEDVYGPLAATKSE